MSDVFLVLGHPRCGECGLDIEDDAVENFDGTWVHPGCQRVCPDCGALPGKRATHPRPLCAACDEALDEATDRARDARFEREWDAAS